MPSAIYAPAAARWRGFTKKPSRDARLNFADPLSRGLLGYWPLLEGAGKIARNYVPFGSAGLVRPGNWDVWTNQTWVYRPNGGRGVFFDNTSGGIGLDTSSPDPGFWHDAFSEATVVVFCTLEDDTNAPQCLYEEGADAEGMELAYRSGPDTFSFAITSSSTLTEVSSTSLFTPDPRALVRLAGTFASDNSMALWVNGVKEATGTATGNPGSHVSGPSLGGFNNNAPIGDHEYGGTIFFAARWNRKLTDAEVRYVLDNPYALLVQAKEWDEAGFVYAAAAAGKGAGPFTELSVMALPGPIHTFVAKSAGGTPVSSTAESPFEAQLGLAPTEQSAMESLIRISRQL